MNTVMAEMYGKAEGCSGGRGGSMHLFDAATEFYGGNAIVGGGLPLAGGLALADKMTGEDRVTACFFGDGAVAEGEFHETHEPRRAVGPARPVRLREQRLRHGHGHRALRIRRPISAPRRPPTTSRRRGRRHGRGRRRGRHAPRRRQHPRDRRPIFLECNTYRFRAHSMFDAQLYRDKDRDRRRGARKGPIVRFQGWLLENGLIHDSDVDRDRGARRCRDRGGRGVCRKRHVGAGGGPDATSSEPAAGAGHACHARRARRSR
jgi:2-oxoisovalerate dehydrogenase E1 component